MTTTPTSDFWAKWQVHLQAVAAGGADLVFLSDGVVWLHEQLKQSYPKATLILDFYDVMGHISEAAQAAISSADKRERWLEGIRNLLLNSCLSEVIDQIKRLRVSPDLAQRISSCLETNRHRMDYRAYRARGLAIGSGAIESANKAVVQARLKRSGQRWTQLGAQGVLNLRTCWMSARWDIVGQHIEPGSCSMAA